MQSHNLSSSEYKKNMGCKVIFNYINYKITVQILETF